MRRFWYAVFITIHVALLAGCRGEDRKAPTWQVVVNGRMTGETIPLSVGNTMAFTADASDNVELGRIFVELKPRWAGDNVAGGFALTVGDWRESIDAPLSGRTALVGRNWTIPDTLQGSWLIQADLTDLEGLSAPTQQFYVDISNPWTTDLDLDSLAGEAASNLPTIPAIQRGQALDLRGDVYDPEGIGEVLACVITAEGDTLSSWLWNAGAVASLALSESELMLPSDALLGLSRVSIQVSDELSNATEYYFFIEIAE